jgi:transposase InsO family protein
MACSNVVEGMPVDVSSPPPKCEHCILGKQTCSSVPKQKEGARATKPLECIYVDLCGPMTIPSRFNRLYSMNIIDNYSSFVWSLPLRSKDEAAPVLKSWLLQIELQGSHCLRSFVTDNGELASLQIQKWCEDKGILHLLMAPYTSAHNGHAERLHWTLLDKARAMMSACKSPTNMWDEFCATAAYLGWSKRRHTASEFGVWSWWLVRREAPPYRFVHSIHLPLLSSGPHRSTHYCSSVITPTSCLSH